ncbi:hypothetical protein BU16DRAFT_609825 [Lophium mytilinum]|uniref:Uncharacterized protein n=1 Tax=Lophium mytilinum TaxID=390894 RepID=A0A6A6QT45_9PEZI|nr:hypothetical protein BU16DRAFT_609825 [Lophium mytilinum]
MKAKDKERVKQSTGTLLGVVKKRVARVGATSFLYSPGHDLCLAHAANNLHSGQPSQNPFHFPSPTRSRAAFSWHPLRHAEGVARHILQRATPGHAGSCRRAKICFTRSEAETPESAAASQHSHKTRNIAPRRPTPAMRAGACKPLVLAWRPLVALVQVVVSKRAWRRAAFCSLLWRERFPCARPHSITSHPKKPPSLKHRQRARQLLRLCPPLRYADTQIHR